MKLLRVLFALALLLGLASFTACKKKGQISNKMPPLIVEGVSVDLPKLQSSVDATGNADLQSSVRSVLMAFRYRQYDKALMDMEKVTNDPNLNEEQKKLANEVFEQVKQVVAKAPPPAPAQ